MILRTVKNSSTGNETNTQLQGNVLLADQIGVARIDTEPASKSMETPHHPQVTYPAAIRASASLVDRDDAILLSEDAIGGLQGAVAPGGLPGGTGAFAERHSLFPFNLDRRRRAVPAPYRKASPAPGQGSPGSVATGRIATGQRTASAAAATAIAFKRLGTWSAS